MFTKYSLSLSSFIEKHKRGAAMTEYAILLAFVVAIASVAFLFGYDLDWGKNSVGEDIYVGNNLGSSIFASIINAFSVLSKMLGH